MPGSANSGGLVTLVDRKSRYTIITKINSKHADHVYQRIRKRLKKLDPNLRHSVTFDNGTEFANCKRLRRYPGIELYVAARGYSVSSSGWSSIRDSRKEFIPSEKCFNVLRTRFFKRWLSHEAVTDAFVDL